MSSFLKKAICLLSSMVMIFIAVSPIAVHASSYELNHSKLTMYVGDTKKLKLTSDDSIKVTWKLSNKKVVTVSKTGKLTAKKAGTATITATVGKQKLTCKVTVKKLTMKKEAEKLTKTYQKEIKEVLKYTNQYRKANGVSSLKLDSELSKAASYRSLEMAKNDIFSHTRPNGKTCFTVLDEYKIKTVGYRGENLALTYGEPDAEVACELWYDSSGHRENMLDSYYGRIGIGIAVSGDKVYYTQIFAK